MTSPTTSFTLDDLAAIVARRATSGDPSSYTAKLMRKGVPQIAKKLGEEAVEAAIAAALGRTDDLRAEAADVLYHLVVLLHATGVPLPDVYAELERRTAVTGLDEKASRPKD
jgi:phosphoribosyl-ATP pyrophosphohydrolase